MVKNTEGELVTTGRAGGAGKEALTEKGARGKGGEIYCAPDGGKSLGKGSDPFINPPFDWRGLFFGDASPGRRIETRFSRSAQRVSIDQGNQSSIGSPQYWKRIAA